MKVIRVRAIEGRDLERGYCTGCLGCNARPAGEDCIDVDSRQDFIFIHDTPEAKTAYTALVLEHGRQLD